MDYDEPLDYEPLDAIEDDHAFCLSSDKIEAINQETRHFPEENARAETPEPDQPIGSPAADGRDYTALPSPARSAGLRRIHD